MFIFLCIIKSFNDIQNFSDNVFIKTTKDKTACKKHFYENQVFLGRNVVRCAI